MITLTISCRKLKFWYCSQCHHTAAEKIFANILQPLIVLYITNIPLVVTQGPNLFLPCSSEQTHTSNNACTLTGLCTEADSTSTRNVKTFSTPRVNFQPSPPPSLRSCYICCNPITQNATDTLSQETQESMRLPFAIPSVAASIDFQLSWLYGRQLFDMEGDITNKADCTKMTSELRL